MTRKIAQDTPKTLFLALGAWALATVVATLEGVFAKLSIAELAGLGVFAFAFATATVYLDRSLREYLQGATTRRLLTFALEMDLGIAVGTLLALGLAQGDVLAALARFPLAVVIVFAVPLAAAGHVLLAERLLSRRAASRAPSAALSPPAAKALAGHPAGT